MSSTTFASLPIEVAYPIFAFACAPDRDSLSRPVGPTLNLVSKAFREICLTTGPDLEHVAIRGAHRMKAFLEMLLSRTLYAKRVRSLFLAGEILFDTGEFSRLILQCQVSPTKNDPYTAPLHIENVLLAIDLFYLRVLFISVPMRPNMTIPYIQLPENLPALTDLFLSGIAVVPAHPHISCTPKLQNMQILNFTDSYPVENSPATEVAYLAPSLKRLKLSILPSGFLATQLIPALQDIVGDPIVGSVYDEARPVHSESCLRTPPQLILAFIPLYISSNPLISRLTAGSALDPVMTYRTGVERFQGFRPIPDNVRSVRTTDPVVMLPVPAVRDVKMIVEDDKVRGEAFWRDWLACVAGREVMWT
ncbi:hypothetical protein EIP91_004068 [Steccherinum ochraceum]|uniref:F-box domain-containing protein n=1 Tax=Steccherinum ochraceum TaxID=92696 RepID=A0A4R0RPY7_9APHY|nr:hypothetical protein EIP91_004068 [Steccherinum ochraceum]